MKRQRIDDYFPNRKRRRFTRSRWHTFAAKLHAVTQGRIARTLLPLPAALLRSAAADTSDAANMSGRQEMIDTSYTRLGKGVPKKWKKGWRRMLGNRFIMTVTAQRIANASNNGRSVTNLINYANGTFGADPAPQQYIYANGFQDWQDSFNQLGADEPATAQSLKTRKWVVEWIKISHTLKNQTNVPVQVWLYDIVPRRDETSTTGLVLSSPAGDWFDGMNNASTSVYVGPAHPAATPFMSGIFTRMWKVVRVHKFTLGGGADHVHHVTIRPNLMLSKEMIDEVTVKRNQTYFCMCVIEGNPVNSAPVTGDTVTQNQIGFSEFGVNVITNYKSKCYAMEKSRTVMSAFNTLPGALTGEVTVREGDEVVIPADVT